MTTRLYKNPDSHTTKTKDTNLENPKKTIIVKMVFDTMYNEVEGAIGFYNGHIQQQYNYLKNTLYFNL
jgi:hypothetical protein